MELTTLKQIWAGWLADICRDDPAARTGHLPELRCILFRTDEHSETYATVHLESAYSTVIWGKLPVLPFR